MSLTKKERRGVIVLRVELLAAYVSTFADTPKNLLPLLVPGREFRVKMIS